MTTTIPSLYRDPEVRRLAREVIRLQRDVRTFGRASQAAYRSSDGTGNDENLGDFDDDGNPLDEQGHSEDWVPPTPTIPDVNPYREAVEIVWDGTFDDAEWDASIADVLIHILPDVATVPEEATVVGTFGREGGVFPYNVTLDEDIKFVALQAVSRAGVTGGWSFPTQLIPLLGVDPAELAELQGDLNDLNTVILPSLQTDLAGLEGLFPIQSTSIADGAITTPKIIVGTLLGNRIVVNSLSGDTIIANTIYGDRIVVNTLSGDRIIANTISGDRIIANTLSGDRIVANTINGNRIIAGTITATHLTADAINGKTITGVTITGGTITGTVSVTGTMVVTGGISSASGSDVPVYGGMSVFGAGSAGGLYVQGAITVVEGIDSSGGPVVGFKLFAPNHDTTTNPANVRYGTGGQLIEVTSSRRAKDNIVDLNVDYNSAIALRPREWDSNLPGDNGARGVGFVSEEAEDLGLDQWVEYNEDGEVQSFSYDRWTAALQAIVQRHHSEIEALKAEINTLKNAA